MNRIKKSSIVLLHGRSIRIINTNNFVGILGVRVIGDPLYYELEGRCRSAYNLNSNTLILKT